MVYSLTVHVVVVGYVFSQHGKILPEWRDLDKVSGESRLSLTPESTEMAEKCANLRWWIGRFFHGFPLPWNILHGGWLVS